MKKTKKFFRYFLWASGLYLVIGTPLYGILYFLAPEYDGLIIGGLIGGLIGCATGNAALGVIFLD